MRKLFYRRTGAWARVAALAAALFTAATLQGQSSPTNVSVSPSSGSGPTQTFAFTAAAAGGYQNLTWMEALINYGLDGSGACFFHYAGGTVYISNDNGAGWLANGALGASGTIENSQCRLDLGASSVSGSGNNLTLNLALTFKPRHWPAPRTST